MFFVLSQLFSWLISPLSQIILSFVGSVFLKGRSKKVARLLLIILSLFYTSPITSWVALNWWEVRPVRYSELSSTYPIGVVLCGMSNMLSFPEDRPHFNSSADRLTDAVVLYKKGIIERILLSGGSGYLQFPELRESRRLKDFMLQLGVPDSAIIVEDQSRNTRQNAFYTMEIVNEQYPGSTLLLITSATHMRRAQACFRKVGSDPVLFSSDTDLVEFNWSYRMLIPDLGALITWTKVMKEWVGYFVYWVVGYI